MARTRLFVSSTCYDMHPIRESVRRIIHDLGHDPVMSEYSDVLYDPRHHTHESCLKAVGGCDICIHIIGGRYGGQAVTAAYDIVNIELVKALSTQPDILNQKRLSITQLEIVKAIEDGIPVLVFVQHDVLSDHRFYQLNKDDPEFIKKSKFPSIQKREMAPYIFEFINFLQHRLENNSIFSFASLEEVKDQLRSQCSQYFQRLLDESRGHRRDTLQVKGLNERIDSLTQLMLDSRRVPAARELARWALRLRHLAGFVSQLRLRLADHRSLLLSDMSWKQLLRQAEIKDILGLKDKGQSDQSRPLFFVRDDRTFYLCEDPHRARDDFRVDWDGFRKLDTRVREDIVDAVLGDRELHPVLKLNYYDTPIDQFLPDVTELAVLEVVTQE